MAKNALSKLENRIETNIKKAWYENGLCLMQIREEKLYKKDYTSFENYLSERWNWKRTYANRMIAAAKTYQEIEANSGAESGIIGTTLLPASEWQIRPLDTLETTAEKVHVWNEVAKATAGGRVTAKTVEEAVEVFKANPVPVAPVVEVETKNTNVTSSKHGVMYAPGSNDECYTPDYGVLALVPHMAHLKGKTIWCPFDKEDSQFVQVLREAGFYVVHSHIDDGQDFYTYEPDQWDVIVSNPPFTDKRLIFERALSFGKPFALVMSNTWLNDAAPKVIFEQRGLQMLMFAERMKFLNQDNTENKITFSSSYFCADFLVGRDIQFSSLKDFGYGKK